ncbi:MAG TPA: efflux RND transporter periplasmic adaptor subunit [Gemmatimonadaceae bacterium]|nr:efflux RND transporter periplasmic adaptor subunit [Gemmatimonadaceae bacterium]
MIIAYHRRARVLASTFFGLLAASGCSKASGTGVQQQGQSGGGGPPPPQVGIVTVSPTTIAEPYELGAQVQPYRRVEVRARVEGIIVERPFTEGSVVSKGQVLYKLDPVKYDAAYRSAVARLDNAKRTVARLEPLIPKHAVAQQDVDNAHSELESSQAAVDAAKKDLDDCVIRAEINGQVGRARLELGARVTGPGDLLTTIDELDPVYVTFHPSSQQLATWERDPRAGALIRRGSSLAVRVVLPDSSLLPRAGRLDFIAPSLDSASGTEEFRATFSNGDRRLLPGQFVRVRLEGFTRAAALAVPQRAVMQGMGRQFVYVVGSGDTVTARDVKPGPWSGQLWIIDSGLSPGDRVIVEGTQKVGPGRVVKPVALADSTKSSAAK